MSAILSEASVKLKSDTCARLMALNPENSVLRNTFDKSTATKVYWALFVADLEGSNIGIFDLHPRITDDPMNRIKNNCPITFLEPHGNKLKKKPNHIP